MLRPSKHAHPDQTTLAAATLLLRELRRNRAVQFDDLKKVIDKRTTGADYLFAPAMSLLYLMGLVEYRPTADVFEYVGQ